MIKKIGTLTANFGCSKLHHIFFPQHLNLKLFCRSKLYIEIHYREFEGLPEDIVVGDCMEMEADTPSGVVSPGSFDMCGVSPGFVRFSKFTDIYS